MALRMCISIGIEEPEYAPSGERTMPLQTTEPVCSHNLAPDAWVVLDRCSPLKTHDAHATDRCDAPLYLRAKRPSHCEPLGVLLHDECTRHLLI